MFGWLRKMVRQMVAEEAQLIKEKLADKTADEEGFRIKAEAELRSLLTDALATEFKNGIRQELKNEMETRISQLFAGFKEELKKEIKEEFNKDVTEKYKQQMSAEISAEIKERFAGLQEQLLVRAENNGPQMTCGQAASPSEDLSAIPETLVNIGPGLKKILNNKNPSVNKELILNFINNAAGKINPSNSKSMTEYILKSNNNLRE